MPYSARNIYYLETSSDRMERHSYMYLMWLYSLHDGGSTLRDGGSTLRDGSSTLRDGGSTLYDGGTWVKGQK